MELSAENLSHADWLSLRSHMISICQKLPEDWEAKKLLQTLQKDFHEEHVILPLDEWDEESDFAAGI